MDASLGIISPWRNEEASTNIHVSLISPFIYTHTHTHTHRERKKQGERGSERYDVSIMTGKLVMYNSLAECDYVILSTQEFATSISQFQLHEEHWYSSVSYTKVFSDRNMKGEILKNLDP